MNTRAKFKAMYPVLPTRDVTRAIEYYTEQLGFVLVLQDTEQNPRYAGVRREGVMLHLQWHASEDFSSVEKLSLRFCVDDVDALFEEYKPQNVFHDGTALRDTSWGTREFAFYDGDGNGLFFYRDL